jgi:glycosyltransferase involved in cell wall biosynthesis
MELRILHLLSGEGRAGSTKSVISLIEGLIRAGHKVFVGVSEGTYNHQLMKEKGFEVLPIEMGIKCAKNVAGFCRRERICIINSHLSKDRHLAILAKLFGAKAKVVFTRRAMPRSSRINTLFYRLFADRMIAVAEEIKDVLVKSGVPEEMVDVVHNGVEIEEFESVDDAKIEELRRRYRICDEKIVGMVARPDKLKGHTLFLKALREVEGFRALLVGVSEDDMGRDVEKLGVGDRVILCGFQRETAPFYHLMTAKVLPSFSEGSPLAILEAMAAGVPVICSRIPQIAEIVEDRKCGLLFEPGNVEDLSDKIKLLLKDEPLRRRLAEEGRKVVRDRFSIEKSVALTEKVYYDLLK